MHPLPLRLLGSLSGGRCCAVDAIISAQDLADTYLPPFVSCANRGNASGVMCSYSKKNGDTFSICAVRVSLTVNASQLQTL